MKKKKAFTLTELLVVVVIIGVLSAVVLPKFTKIIEARKTTEAENILSAVRNEQEARCMIGKNYATNTNQLASLPKNYANSDNFSYQLTNGGVSASSKSSGYALQIPSYTDGRICCTGDDCDQLNKNYPKCSELSITPATCEDAVPDAPIGNRWAPDLGCDDTHSEGQEKSKVACTCGGYKYTRYTCVNDEWTTYEDDQCEECSCDQSAKPDTTQACTPSGYQEACGVKTREVKCDASTNYVWQAPEWSTISCKATEACKSNNACQRSYCTGSAYVDHEESWYSGKTWTNDKTECCEAREACPQTCEPGKIRDPRVTYTGDSWGACCKDRCDVFCTGQELYETYGGQSGRPCTRYNAQLKGQDSSRTYNYLQSGTQYYEGDPSVCYRCSTYSAPDFTDLKGNVLVKGWDADTCSYGGQCPAGYLQDGHVCYKIVDKQAVVGISMQAYINAVGTKDVTFYDTGTKKIDGKGYVEIVGYNVRYGVNLPRCTEGNLAKMCKKNQITMCVADWNKVPEKNDNSYQPTIITDFTRCGGLSVLNTQGDECALGEMITGVAIKVCE